MHTNKTTDTMTTDKPKINAEDSRAEEMNLDKENNWKGAGEWEMK